jgi:hypothetical protein
VPAADDAVAVLSQRTRRVVDGLAEPTEATRPTESTETAKSAEAPKPPESTEPAKSTKPTETALQAHGVLLSCSC